MNSYRLKGKMIEKKYTQKKMASRLGITQQSFNAKINQRTQFTLDEVSQIVEILELEDQLDIFFEKITPNTQQIRDNK